MGKLGNIEEDVKQEASTSPSQEQGKVEGLEGRQNRLEYIMMGLIVVLFIGFAGMFVAVGQMMIDSLNDKTNSIYDLKTKIDAQNVKIDNLTKAVQK